MCEPRPIYLTENQIQMLDKAIITHLFEGDEKLQSQYRELREHLAYSYSEQQEKED